MTGGNGEAVDLLVFGTGAAALTAALVGAREGLRVLVCEKSALIGGTTATSAGTLWIPGNRQSTRDGVPDSAEDGRLYLENEIGAAIRRDLFEAFLHSGPRAVDYLEATSKVRFVATRNHPDYHPDEPGARYSGRALAPLSFDGRMLGADFPLLRPPRETLMILGGMMVGRREIPDLLRPYASWSAFSHVTSILLRHMRDRLSHPRGTRLMLGNALIARFLVSLREMSVPILLETALVGLAREGGRVTGAFVEAGGRRRLVEARVGVVLATGGFPASDELKRKFLRECPQARAYGFGESSGDALRAATGIGAAVDQKQNSGAFWTPISILERPDGSEALWAHGILDRAKPGLIAVDAAGRRFVNEGESYHDFVLAMLEAHKKTPAIPAWLVCDRRFVRKYGLGLIRPIFQRLRPYERAGYLTRAATIRELASRIGVDADGLEETVREHNIFAADGVDRAFGKGSTGMSRHNGDPRHAPNPCLAPIEKAPFFAVAVYPGIIGTSTGLRTDADARVLDGQGRVIDGLYACGNDMASVMRGSYPGPGITLGPGVAFAFRAARHAAGKPEAPPL